MAGHVVLGPGVQLLPPPPPPLGLLGHGFLGVGVQLLPPPPPPGFDGGVAPPPPACAASETASAAASAPSRAELEITGTASTAQQHWQTGLPEPDNKITPGPPRLAETYGKPYCP